MDKTVLIYNGHDCINTWDVAMELRQLVDETYMPTYNFTEKLLEPLMFMMTRGVLVSFDKLQVVKKEVIKRAGEAQDRLNNLAGRELNVNSAKQLKQYFYIEKGIPPYTKRNSTGGSSITCDDKALQRIGRGTAARAGLPEAKLIQEIRGLLKLHGTYLDLTLDEDKRFRCSYNPRGTRFGRLSSSKTIFGTGMNMQNLPYEFKKFLVADPGYMMWEIDKAKAEWVVVAYKSGDPNMIKVIEEGLDPHIHTAHLMTNVEKSIIELDEELIGHNTDVQIIGKIRNEMRRKSEAVDLAFENAEFIPRNMSIRQCGKKSNHGLNYDEGFRTFALQNEILETDAKKIINLYKHKAYPGIPLWHREVQRQLGEDRTLVNCFGRKYKFLGQWTDDLFKAAYAFVPQSTVADLVNQGIIDTYSDRLPYMKLLEMLGQVHDSIVGQNQMEGAPEQKGYSTYYAALDMAKGMKRTAEYMNNKMEYSGREFYIESDLKVGAGWGDLKTVDLSANVDKLATQINGVYNEFRAGA